MHYVANGFGDDLDSPSTEQMQSFLDALPLNDIEHGAAWCVDADGNCLEYEVGGNLTYEHIGVPARHLAGVEKKTVLKLWQLLVDGKFAEIESEPWQSGVRPTPSTAEVLRHEEEMREWQISQDLEFYDSLGAEHGASRCRASTCERRTVAHSVFCRSHHFEKIKGRTCPFVH